MSNQIQLLATAATLDLHRRGKPSPLAILRLLTVCRRGNATVSITIPNQRPLVRFELHGAAKGWSAAVIQRCAIPSLFAFGPLKFAFNHQVVLLDAPRFLDGSPEATLAEIEAVASTDSEWIEIEFDPKHAEWLSPPKVRLAIEDMTWAGAPTDQARRQVHLRCVATQQVVEQPLLGICAVKKMVHVDGYGVQMQASITANAYAQSGGRVRHVGTGTCSATSVLGPVPRGVSIDIDYDIYGPDSDMSFLCGNTSFEMARPSLVIWLNELIKGRACQRICESQAKTRVEVALQRLEERRRDLHVCEYVKHHRELVYRVPTNENQVVALFLKLEAQGALPFKCQVLEYTPKSGIDAIGHFSVKMDGLMEMFAPIEFEYKFDSFVIHGHPVRHTKLVVCWSADEGRGRSLANSAVGAWLKFYSAEGVTVPVVVLKHLPGISIERING